MNSIEDEEIIKYPGVEIAYDTIEKSYDWAIQRLDSVDDGIDKRLTWISSITIGVVGFFSTKLPPSSFICNVWFLIAMVFFVVAVSIGMITKFYGSLIIPSPKVFFDKWLHFSEFKFKKTALFDAGNHFVKNLSLINRKGRLSSVMMICFIVEIVFLGLWIITLNAL